MPINNAKLLTLQPSAAVFYIGMFTDLSLRIYGASGGVPSNNLVSNPRWEDGATDWAEVLVGGTSQVVFGEANTRLLPQQSVDQLLENGDFEQGAVGWTTDTDNNASVTFSGGQCTMTGGNNAGQTARLGQLVETLSATLAITAQLTGDTVTLNIGTSPGGSEILQVVGWDGSEQTFFPTQNFYLGIESQGSGAVSVFDEIVIKNDITGEAGIGQQVTTTNGGNPHFVQVATRGDQEYRVQVGTAISDGTYLDVYTTEATFLGEFTPAGDYWITVTAYGDVSDDVQLREINSAFVEATDEVAFATPYLESELRDLYFVVTPEARVLYVLHPKYPTKKLTYNQTTDTWFFDDVVFANPPAVWTGSNWPGVGAYFQGRLWLGSTPDQPETFWGSKSGLPEDFDLGTALDDEAIEFTLAVAGRIEWMIGTKNLVIGTAQGEHILTGDNQANNLITPSKVNVEQQSSYGSRSVQPIQVGDQIFYVSPDGLKLRGMQYEWTANNWLSKDLTFFSEHITESGIIDIAWAQNPDQLFWCVLENGDAACLTYERGENIYGWHKHTTNGKFIDMTVGSYYGRSVLVAAVQRVTGQINLEIQDDTYYLDGGEEVTAQGGAGAVTQTFPGFEHIAGFVAQVILDGALHPDVLVDQNGVITTEYPGHQCVAGLKYISELETLPFDSRMQTGASQTYMKRYNKLQISLLDSAEPIVNNKRPPTREPASPMNQIQPNNEGLSRVRALTFGWDRESKVNVKQDLPLPCIVLSIGGEHNQEKV